MKKYVIAFIIFVLAFGAALGYITYMTVPEIQLKEQQTELEWHGRVENEFGTYNGALLGDLFNGEGSFAFLSGEKYTGEWVDSEMSGDGTVTFPGIGIYSGEMSDSKRNGQGVFTWDSGESYDGDWKDDSMSGEGRYVFTNGSVLEGVFSENKAVSGTITYEKEAAEDDPDTEIVYLIYSFSDSEKTVSFKTKGGLNYEGDITGLFGEGKATVTYPSGNLYDGQLKNGMREGLGKFTWKDKDGKTTAYYNGSWTQDHMNGPGEYHYSDAEYPYLKGSFENDSPSGTLTYYKEAGNTFETKWKNGNCYSVKET